MAEFLVSVPDLKIVDTYVEAQKAAHAAKRAIDDHDTGQLSLRKGIEVKVKDQLGMVHNFKVHGVIKNTAEEIKR